MARNFRKPRDFVRVDDAGDIRYRVTSKVHLDDSTLEKMLEWEKFEENPLEFQVQELFNEFQERESSTPDGAILRDYWNNRKEEEEAAPKVRARYSVASWRAKLLRDRELSIRQQTKRMEVRARKAARLAKRMERAERDQIYDRIRKDLRFYRLLARHAKWERQSKEKRERQEARRIQKAYRRRLWIETILRGRLQRRLLKVLGYMLSAYDGADRVMSGKSAAFKQKLRTGRNPRNALNAKLRAENKTAATPQNKKFPCPGNPATGVHRFNPLDCKFCGRGFFEVRELMRKAKETT